MSVDRLLAWDRERRELLKRATGADEATSAAFFDRAREIEDRICAAPTTSLAAASAKLVLVAEVIEGGSTTIEEDARLLREVAAFLRPSAPDPHLEWWREIEAIFGRHAEMRAMPDPADATEWEAEYQRLFEERWRLTHLLSEHAPLSLRGAAARLRLWLLMIAEDDGSQWVDGLDRHAHAMVAD